MEAINMAGSCMGIVSKEGIVLASEKKVSSKLLDVRAATEKIFKVDLCFSWGVDSSRVTSTRS